MKNDSPYIKAHKITSKSVGSCDVYYLKPGGHDKKHYHDGIEIEYVLQGTCKTHKQGEVYIRQRGDVHEALNDSKDVVVIVCLTIPPESVNNTHYL